MGDSGFSSNSPWTALVGECWAEPVAMGTSNQIFRVYPMPKAGSVFAKCFFLVFAWFEEGAMSVDENCCLGGLSSISKIG
jgi:hypothetical protein